jgi:hypothetical protein
MATPAAALAKNMKRRRCMKNAFSSKKVSAKAI